MYVPYKQREEPRKAISGLMCTNASNRVDDDSDVGVISGLICSCETGIFGDLFSAHPVTGAWTRLNASGTVPCARSV